MKIAYVLSQFPSVSETFIKEEILALEKLGVEIFVFSLKKSNPQEEILTKDPVKTINVLTSPFLFSIPLIMENFKQILRQPKIYFAILLSTLVHLIRQPAELLKTLAIFPKSIYFASLVKHHHCERVHAHFCTIPFAAAEIIGKINKLPVSVTAHGFDIFEKPSVDLVRRLDKAQPFITISTYNKNYLTSLSPHKNGDQIKIVHCGINLEKFPYKKRTSKNQIKNILVIARLEKVKGLDILLDALDIVKKKGVQFTCKIIGDGSQKNALLRKTIALGLEDKIFFAGFQPHKTVIESLNQSDFLVLPSRSEGIPVSVMEAIACGLPVIASNISGLPEIVEDGKTGILVPPENSQAFADAILLFCNNPKLIEKYSAYGREKIQTEFNIETNARQLLGLWSS